MERHNRLGSKLCITFTGWCSKWNLICSLRSLLKIRKRDWSKLITLFWFMWLTGTTVIKLVLKPFWFPRVLENGRVFIRFKSLNIWIKFFFFELLPQQKLSFIRVVIFHVREFKQVWSLSFLCSTLRRFCLVFLFDFLKWNSILCQIYWIMDYNNHWNWFVLRWRTLGSKNMQISNFFDKMAMIT